VCFRATGEQGRSLYLAVVVCLLVSDKDPLSTDSPITSQCLYLKKDKNLFNQRDIFSVVTALPRVK
jgi:hypothetical protein